MDRQTGLEARCWALLNVGVKGAIKLPLLIVHLTQDHVVLQEEFVSHTKSGKSKQEREAMVGSQWMVGAPDRTPPGPGGPGESELSREDPRKSQANPASHPGSAQPLARPTAQATGFHDQVPRGVGEGVGLVGRCRNDAQEREKERWTKR